MVRRLLIAVAVAALGAVFAVPAAQGAFGIAEWEALTCSENSDTPEVGEAPIVGLPPLATDPEQCTGETEAKWFTQAAGHPDYGITDFTVNTFPAGVVGFPEGFVKEIVVDTPEGLSVNPEATPQCTVAQLEASECPAASQVGVNYLTVAAESPPCAGAPAGVCPQARVGLPVYNLVPFFAVPSMVGFQTAPGHEVYVVGSLDPVDQHVTFTISDIDPPSEVTPPIVGSRLVFDGKAGNGTYLTMPSNCAGGQISDLHLESQGPPFEPEVSTDEASYETAVGADGCDKVPFDPTVNVNPKGNTVDTPLATSISVNIPFDPTEAIANSYLKVAKVVLPAGTGLNPASANGLVGCTDAQFGKGTNDPIGCPAASRIGAVEVQTPSLPANSIGGDVYVGQPLSGDPSSGEQFRIFIHAFSERYGVNVRLLGKVFPNLATGQLTAVVADNPQATFKSFKLILDGGPKGVLTSPPTCGPHTTTTALTPWTGEPDATPSDGFTLGGYPGGGACPPSLGARPFDPSYSLVPQTSAAAKYSPLRVRFGRDDGEQEIKAVSVTLSEGLTGNLSGIPYCSEAAIAAAGSTTGVAQQASPSCPAASRVGSATIAAGSGTGPLQVGGTAYLAGPYKGAPLSLVVITPAVAGPYDLGTVVVRSALEVNPRTAQITAVSDPIPDVFGGVKLSIRRIDVNVDRERFMLNPTNCDSGGSSGILNGGGADPANPAAWSSIGVNDPFSATGCSRLKFKPKLYTKLLGPTKRAKNPRIRAVLEARNGDANIKRTALVLPPSLFLDQSHIKTICTRVQLNARECPRASIYGQAIAHSPLLDKRLKGPVYLTSSNNTLPDLVADLRGQVNIRLYAVIGSKRGGLKTTFYNVPDVPVSKFILNMRGGNKSLLVNSTDICKKRGTAYLNMKGQNVKKLERKRYQLNVPRCRS